LAWKIEFERDAIRQLNQLDQSIRAQIVAYMERRIVGSGNPRQLGKPLRGPKRGLWSYRVGHYRIVCRIEDQRVVIVVVSVGHRKDVYR
jgi:mRNA interferase RelE/StbE